MSMGTCISLVLASPHECCSSFRTTSLAPLHYCGFLRRTFSLLRGFCACFAYASACFESFLTMAVSCICKSVVVALRCLRLPIVDYLHVVPVVPFVCQSVRYRRFKRSIFLLWWCTWLMVLEFGHSGDDTDVIIRVVILLVLIHGSNPIWLSQNASILYIHRIFDSRNSISQEDRMELSLL
jgi:hypothetical protein